ncbi:predicted protein, partial [Scheffersomyces stipitis CBS 6054]
VALSLANFLNSVLRRVFFSFKLFKYSTKVPASDISETGVFSCNTLSNASINSPFFFSVLNASKSIGYFSSYFANFFILERITGGS